MKKLLSFVILFFVSISIALAFDAMNMPKFGHYVNDYSSKFSSQDITNFDSKGKSIETKTSAQVVAVLFPNRNGKELIDIGLKAFRDNGIGQKTKNNGVLLLISTEEKKIRIVTGYGLEGDIPDIVASDIIEKDIRPYVNSGDLSTAVSNYYTRVEGILEKTSPPISKDTTSTDPKKESDNIAKAAGAGTVVGLILSGFLSITFFIIIVVALLVAGVYFKSILLFMFLFGFFLGYIITKMGGFSGGGFGGGGFGGSGGFSGGGGSSGGGGAGD